jgi:DNA polymerase-3 subunit delta'
MSFADIKGQEQALKTLRNNLKQHQVSHAYLFLGPDGTGKKYIALGFAKALNCNQAQADFCNECLSCMKIERGHHPDVNLVRPQGNYIRIEQIRELQAKIAFNPLEGENKVVIIDEVEKLTPEATASLLKTLEEPPANTIIILISNNSFALPPTILSRCRLIKFNLLSPEDMVNILREKRSLSREEAQLTALLSLGKIGKALNQDPALLLAIREEALRLFDLGGMDRLKYILNKGKEWEKDRNEAGELLNSLLVIGRDLMALASGSNIDLLINKDIEEKLMALASNFTLDRIVDLLQRIIKTQLLLKQNVNTQLAITNLLMHIFETNKFGMTQ